MLNRFQVVQPAESQIRHVLAKIRDNRAALLAGGNRDEIHDFRVGLRSLRTYLRLARKLWSAALVEPIRNQLKRLQRATSIFQDEIAQDKVIRTALRALGLIQAARPWLDERKEYLESQREKAKEVICAPGVEKLLKRAETLLAPLAGLEIASGRIKNLRKAYREERKRFKKRLKAHEEGEKDDTTLHRLRIRAKRLRYSLEGFGFLDPRRRQWLHPRTKAFQKAVGDLRDTVGALGVVARDNRIPYKVRIPLKRELSKREALCRTDIDKILNAFARLKAR